MEKPVLELIDHFNSQTGITSQSKLIKATFRMAVMFTACLLICHSPKLLHGLAEWMSM